MENQDMLAVVDFSEASDLSSRAQQIRLLPFRQKQVLPLVVALLLFVAVLALEIPIEEILRQILKMAGF
jgi:hypothetical protein